MRATCPKYHSELANVLVSSPDGDASHHVHVLISTRNARYRVYITESWGSETNEESCHRRIVAARGLTIGDAVEVAISRSREAGVFMELLISAISQAEDHAEDASIATA